MLGRSHWAKVVQQETGVWGQDPAMRMDCCSGKRSWKLGSPSSGLVGPWGGVESLVRFSA